MSAKALTIRELCLLSGCIRYEKDLDEQRESFQAAYLGRPSIRDTTTDERCCICDDFSFYLYQGACEHQFCERCLYEELSAIGIVHCPICAFNRSKQNQCREDGGTETRASVAGFSFSPDTPSILLRPALPGAIDTFASGKLRAVSSEIFPIAEVHTPLKQREVSIYCPFHKEISPYPSTCNRILSCTTSSLKQIDSHIIECCCETIGRLLNVSNGPLPQAPSKLVLKHSTRPIPYMPFTTVAVTEECRRLFPVSMNNQTSKDIRSPRSLQLDSTHRQHSPRVDVYELPQHRVPFIAHLIVRDFKAEYVERQKLLSNPNHWNVQVILFANPYEAHSQRLFTNIVIGLDILFPNTQREFMEFWVDRERLRQVRILRYAFHIIPCFEGRYTFDLRWSCSISNTLGKVTTFQSRLIKNKLVTHLVVGDNGLPITIQAHLHNLRENPSTIHVRPLVISPQVMSFLDKGAVILQAGFQRGFHYFGKSGSTSSEQNTIPIYTYDEDLEKQLDPSIMPLLLPDLEALFVYAHYCYTVHDACSFLFGCRMHAVDGRSALLLHTGPFLQAVMHIFDVFRYSSTVQVFGVALFLQLSATLPEFGASSPAINALMGRIRRARALHGIANAEIDELILVTSRQVTMKGMNFPVGRFDEENRIPEESILSTTTTEIPVTNTQNEPEV
ncbi:hypothetical protein GMRT_14963 [Giardia muris]|uniref:RING-type domain-containing protein n=1 Tax=Giardia muris TaxID=5742 RepID=A0A4Z1STE4_GIAMU|nr:hypothetical protein GMRT_14963 [Giardia muris]|eukprot:TNJ29196.1 hypothetical protein GMRT_14963 [Giardia muris]